MTKWFKTETLGFEAIRIERFQTGMLSKVSEAPFARGQGFSGVSEGVKGPFLRDLRATCSNTLPKYVCKHSLNVLN